MAPVIRGKHLDHAGVQPFDVGLRAQRLGRGQDGEQVDHPRRDGRVVVVAVAVFGQRAHVGPQDWGRPDRAGRPSRSRPTRVLPAGLGEERGAGVVEPVGEGEAGRPVRRSMPGATAADRPRSAPRRRRPQPPGKSPTAQACSASTSRSTCRKFSGASAARAASHRVSSSSAASSSPTVVAVAGGDLRGESQSAQQVEHRARIETRGGRQQRRGRCHVPSQGGPVRREPSRRPHC